MAADAIAHTPAGAPLPCYRIRMPRSRALASLLFAACSSRSPAPAAPAVVSVPDAALDVGPDAMAAPPGVDPRLAAAMTAFERLIRALEVASDCDGAAANLRAFADTDDGKAMARMKDDPAMLALAQEEQAALAAAYPTLPARLSAVMTGCAHSAAMQQAIAESPMFTKQTAPAPVP